MSFILEALKKSEQQRQEQNASQPKVRNQTLTLTSHRPGRRSYLVLAALLPLVLLGGWWLYSDTDAPLGQSVVVSRSTTAPSSLRQAVSPEPVVTAPVLASPLQQAVAAAEPAPVPREVLASPAGSVETTSEQSYRSVESRQSGAFPSTETLVNDQPVATVIETPEPLAVASETLVQRAAQLPRYLDLSMELRDRMPPIAMSMHYYTTDTNRRMVRINGRLLHEGDWVNDGLEIVEIIPSGAILDFLGKTFELRSAGR